MGKKGILTVTLILVLLGLGIIALLVLRTYGGMFIVAPPTSSQPSEESSKVRMHSPEEEGADSRLSMRPEYEFDTDGVTAYPIARSIHTEFSGHFDIWGDYVKEHPEAGIPSWIEEGKLYIDFGDNTSERMPKQVCPDIMGKDVGCVFGATHVYSVPGTFIVSLYTLGQKYPGDDGKSGSKRTLAQRAVEVGEASAIAMFDLGSLATPVRFCIENSNPALDSVCIQSNTAGTNTTGWSVRSRKTSMQFFVGTAVPLGGEGVFNVILSPGDAAFLKAIGNPTKNYIGEGLEYHLYLGASSIPWLAHDEIELLNPQGEVMTTLIY